MKSGAQSSAASKAVESDEDNALLLRASAKRLFETFLQQTADRIYIKDRESRFVIVSQALADLHGFEKRSDLEGLSDFDLFSEEHARQAYEDEQEILKTSEPIINKIEKETWPDGGVTWASSSKQALHLGSKKSVGIFGISRDVTAEYLAQEKLAKSERRLHEQNDIMRSDYQSAEKVQRAIIPGRVPVVKGLELAYLWKPMTGVGGDFISFPRNPGKNVLFFLADVCGHGVTAALYTAFLKYLSTHAGEIYDGDPRHFLNEVNTELSARIEQGFVTGLAGHFSRRDSNGGRTLHISHAGAPQILLFRKESGKVELVELPAAIVMGLQVSQAAAVTRIKMNPGDRFLAYTDGIIEASNPKGEEFGLERLIRLFESLSTSPLQVCLEKIYEATGKFTRVPDQQDDITLLAFEIA